MLRSPASNSLSASPGAAGQDFPWPAPGHLHEVHADAEALAAAMAFTLAAAGRGSAKPLLLARCPRRAALPVQIYGEGLAGLGVDPARLLIVEAKDDAALLQAGLDAARCAGLAAVLLETWGALPRYDLTASRRLVLAAEKSGVPVIVLRGGAVPRASAAHTRWTVRPVPSVPWLADAPGLPACEVELSRRRGGPSGMRWRLEWEDAEGAETNGGFHARRIHKGSIDTAPLSGAVVPVVPVRADAPGGGDVVVRTFGPGGADGQCPAAGGGGRAGQPAGAGAGDGAGRCAGALSRPDELAA
ncbi:ImuA family protein [Novosphingobium naphthalenivorans]|uniref:ImuA family protein n=1 Tax=Novosphingobium naphthalenivorans TaxID=273168 RepID=UPI000AEA8E1B